eukprot:Lithocolla_globosa_v1_NODE_7375_length_954_cov_37.926585.p1 type:complete len:299 gc:universal NODE_7375_length_954_cov_37.926585:44-940(+)
MSSIQKSPEYRSFRRYVAKQKRSVDNKTEWKYYDYGPKTVRCPLICIPTTSGGAECYYKIMMTFGSQGYRVISAEYPNYYTHKDWCDGFVKFIDSLNLEKVHLFGASLGGFLAQQFAQMRPERVASMVLCNSFCDTKLYRKNSPFLGFYSLAPEFALKRFVLSNFPSGQLESAISDSVDFMVEQVEGLDKSTLVARLTLNTEESDLQPLALNGKDLVTIIDVLDEVAISQRLREQLYKYYPEARVCLLKSGGNFPYLSRSDEVTMYMKIHFRCFLDDKYSPQEPLEAQKTAENGSSAT